MPSAVKSIFLGKKSYIDMLVDNTGALGFHARMKGVTSNAIVNTANAMFPDSIPIESMMEIMVIRDLVICLTEPTRTSIIVPKLAPCSRPPTTPDRKIRTPGVLIQEKV